MNDIRPFEEYKEMIKDMRKEEMIKGLYDLSARITEQDKEIERLNNIINNIENYIRARADDNNTCSICSVMTDDLLNILKGSDKE